MWYSWLWAEGFRLAAPQGTSTMRFEQRKKNWWTIPLNINIPKKWLLSLFLLLLHKWSNNLGHLSVTRDTKRRSWSEILLDFGASFCPTSCVFTQTSLEYPPYKWSNAVTYIQGSLFKTPRDGKVPELNRPFVSFSSFVIFHLTANKKLLDTGRVPWCSSVEKPEFVHLVFSHSTLNIFTQTNLKRRWQ